MITSLFISLGCILIIGTLYCTCFVLFMSKGEKYLVRKYNLYPTEATLISAGIFIVLTGLVLLLSGVSI